MLPWSAGIWRVIPKTEVIQLPWRLCAILTVAAAGLFAAAVDDCLRYGVRDKRRQPSLPVLILVALLVSAQCLGDARVQIGQLYFPLWTIVPAMRSPRD